MAVVAALARTAIGAIFVDAGIEVLRKPAGRAAAAAPLLGTVRKAVPQLPANDVTLIRGNALAQLVAGLMLIRGRLPRVAALTLLGSLLPTTLAGHSFWAVTDPQQKAQQRVQFEKNLAIMGGLALLLRKRTHQA